VIDPIDRTDLVVKVGYRGDICFEEMQWERGAEMSEILAASGEVIVEDDDLLPPLDEGVDKVAADHPCSPSDQHPHRDPLACRSDLAVHVHG
jgi:hypothetical protein